MKLTAIALLGLILLAGLGCVKEVVVVREVVKETRIIEVTRVVPAPVPTYAPPETARTASGALVPIALTPGALSVPTPTMLEALGKNPRPYAATDFLLSLNPSTPTQGVPGSFPGSKVWDSWCRDFDPAGKEVQCEGH